MPAAQLLMLLNVIGAAITASAGGSGSYSCGSRGWTRTGWLEIRASI